MNRGWRWTCSAPAGGVGLGWGCPYAPSRWTCLVDRCGLLLVVGVTVVHARVCTQVGRHILHLVQIGVTSKVSRGSMFWFTVPLQVPDSSKTHTANPVLFAATTRPAMPVLANPPTPTRVAPLAVCREVVRKLMCVACCTHMLHH